MKKVVTAFVAALLALGLLAPSALAAQLPNDAGIIIGASALVSKNTKAVDNGSKPDVICPDGTGGGIGLPIINPSPKKAYYEFNIAGIPPAGPPALLARSLNGGPITKMQVCGQVDPGLGGLGAACGSSSGNNGRSVGAVETGALVDYQLEDVGWDFSAGGLFVVTGSARNSADKAKGRAGILALVQARNLGTQCLNKSNTSPKTGGAGIFTVDIVYVIGDAIPDVKHTK